MYLKNIVQYKTCYTGIKTNKKEDYVPKANKITPICIKYVKS